MPGDGVDLLGKDSVQHTPQKDVKVAEQEEEHGHLFRRICKKKEKTSNKIAHSDQFGGCWRNLCLFLLPFCILTFDLITHHHKEPLGQTRSPHENAGAKGQPLKT